MTMYVFYKIICNNPEITECYVGSTKCFRKRKSYHKTACYDEKSREFNYKKYQFIRANGGWDNWTMTPIEELECDTFTQARIREEQLRCELVAALNAKKAYSGLDINEYNKQYRLDNLDKMREYGKQYYYDNLDKKKQISQNYRLKNEEKLKQKITCECGGRYSQSSKAKHFRTNKHIHYEEVKEEL
jgi:hypothetical protein